MKSLTNKKHKHDLECYMTYERDKRVLYHDKPQDKTIIKHLYLDCGFLYNEYLTKKELPCIADMTNEQVVEYLKSHHE